MCSALRRRRGSGAVRIATRNRMMLSTAETTTGGHDESHRVGCDRRLGSRFVVGVAGAAGGAGPRSILRHLAPALGGGNLLRLLWPGDGPGAVGFLRPGGGAAAGGR